MTAYAFLLQQVPVIIAHLRDSMLPLAATDYDRVRVDASKEAPLPFRLEPMQDADDLWGALTDYGNEIARNIHPSPYALVTKIQASSEWHEAGDAAHRITAWLVNHEERIAHLNPSNARDMAAEHLFALIRQDLNRYRIAPRRLRTHIGSCRVCGEAAVYAEWTVNRQGAIAQTAQCTVCHERYDPNMLPTRAAVVALWGPASGDAA